MLVVTAFIPSSSMSSSTRIVTTQLFSAASFLNKAMLAADATDAAAAAAAAATTSVTVTDILLPTPTTASATAITEVLTRTPTVEAATATATATFEPVLLGAAATTTAFEPVLNVPALVASLGILVGAAVLRWRQSAIATAAEQRIQARQRLRELKTEELTRGDGGNNAQIQQAVLNYEQALQKEGQLRTIVPGIALRAPNNPINSDKDQQAIQQFLKKKNGAGSGSKTVKIQEENLQTLQQPQQSSASPSSLNSNDDDNNNKSIFGTRTTGTNSSKNDDTTGTVDEDEISQVGPLLGLCAVFALLASPQFLTLFINEHDTLEILDILSSQ